jgi:hypothetical protein
VTKNCDRCRKIRAAIDEGTPPHEAREANGWDECAVDDCPMVPRPYTFGLVAAGALAALRKHQRYSRP